MANLGELQGRKHQPRVHNRSQAERRRDWDNKWGTNYYHNDVVYPPALPFPDEIVKPDQPMELWK